MASFYMFHGHQIALLVKVLETGQLTFFPHLRGAHKHTNSNLFVILQ